jgi:hypothetical protein
MLNVEKARDQLKKLYGYPPYDTGSNICRNDAYFGCAIEREHGKTVEELEKITGVTRK